MKTTKKDFNKFKKSFLYWAEKFMCPYKVYFFHEKLDDVFANICVDEINKVATVRFNSELRKPDFEVADSPEETGKHEAIHLFLNRVIWLVDQRCIAKWDSSEEWERLVRILEKVI